MAQEVVEAASQALLVVGAEAGRASLIAPIPAARARAALVHTLGLSALGAGESMHEGDAGGTRGRVLTVISEHLTGTLWQDHGASYFLVILKSSLRNTQAYGIDAFAHSGVPLGHLGIRLRSRFFF